MALRNFAYSRYQPDAFGNSTNSMLPAGTIRNSRNLDSRNKMAELSPLGGKQPWATGQWNKTTEDAKKEADKLKLLKAPEKQSYELDSFGVATAGTQAAIDSAANYSGGAGSGFGDKLNIGQGGGAAGRQARRAARLNPVAAASKVGEGTVLKNTDAITNAPKGGKGLSKGGTAGVAAGSAVLGMVGDHYTKNKQETAGGVMSGMGKGAGIGMSVGMLAGPAAPLASAIGAGVGALIGGVWGGISGRKRRRAREEADKKEAAARAAHNAEIARQKKQIKGKASELAVYQRATADSSRYDSQGNLRFKQGGVLRHKVISAERIAYVKSIYEPEEPKEVKGKREIVKLELGGKLVKPTAEPKKLIFKTSNGKVIPIFRRGGKADLAKTNVIVDGPSHEEKNNTGVNGDKGLPIVKKNAKVAEIESKELLLNKDSSVEVEILVKKAKKDPKALNKLGELVFDQLDKNTYDYSNLMVD